MGTVPDRWWRLPVGAEPEHSKKETLHAVDDRCHIGDLVVAWRVCFPHWWRAHPHLAVVAIIVIVVNLLQRGSSEKRELSASVGYGTTNAYHTGGYTRMCRTKERERKRL